LEAGKAHRKPGILNYMAYGAGDIYGGGAYFILSTFTMYYLINVVGMQPVLAGLIPAIGKIWDAVSDPFMGYISDRTPKNRLGKRRIWFAVAVIPIAVTFALLWLPVDTASMAGKFAYYALAYILFFTVSTMSYIPYTALSAEMTHDTRERNILSGFRIFFSYFAVILVALLAKPIIDAFGGNRFGYLVMGGIFSLIFALPWITLVLGTWELPGSKAIVKKEPFFKNFFSIFRNRTGRRHILMYVFSYGTTDILMAWFLFFIIDFMGKGQLFVTLQGTLIVAMMAMLPVYVYLSSKKGHGAAYILGLSLFLAGMVIMAFQGRGSSMGALIVAVVVIGAGLSAGALVPKQILPFVVDLDRLISGQERAGTYASAMALSRKLFHALIIMNGLGLLLNVIDYQKPVPTVLLPYQYVHAVEMSGDGANRRHVIEQAYLKREDGNYQLKAVSDDGSFTENDLYALSAALDTIGFPYTGISDPRKVVQSQDTLRKLRFLFILLPMVMASAGIFVAFFYKMTPENHRLVVMEIERLENGGSKQDVDAQTRAICEELTGLSYEEMYGGR